MDSIKSKQCLTGYGSELKTQHRSILAIFHPVCPSQWLWDMFFSWQKTESKPKCMSTFETSAEITSAKPPIDQGKLHGQVENQGITMREKNKYLLKNDSICHNSYFGLLFQSI